MKSDMRKLLGTIEKTIEELEKIIGSLGKY
jgi:hypothetical protein